MSRKAIALVVLLAIISGFAGLIIGMSAPSVIAGDYDHQIVRELKNLNGNLSDLNSRLRRLERAIKNQ